MLDKLGDRSAKIVYDNPRLLRPSIAVAFLSVSFARGQTMKLLSVTALLACTGCCCCSLPSNLQPNSGASTSTWDAPLTPMAFDEIARNNAADRSEDANWRQREALRLYIEELTYNCAENWEGVVVNTRESALPYSNQKYADIDMDGDAVADVHLYVNETQARTAGIGERIRFSGPIRGLAAEADRDDSVEVQCDTVSRIAD